MRVHRDQRPRETVRQTLTQQFGSTQSRSICCATRSRSSRSSKHSTRMSSLDKVASELNCAPLVNLPGSDNLSFFEPVCSSLSASRTCSTMGIASGGADDDDDPPCATDVGNVCDVETAGETSSVLGSANRTYFRVWFRISDCT